MSLVELKNVQAFYGGIEALKGINLEVNAGEIVTLIGSNGAGKSTTLKSICGQVQTKGEIHFDGKKITSLEPHVIAQSGIAHVPEGRRIFPRLTVKENLEMGAFSVKSKKLIKERIEKSFVYFPRLKERYHQTGGTMSGGEQQMLAIARGLMMNPKILLLDEPSMGLAPVLVDQIFEIIQELNDAGMTILLVEQNAYQALQIAHRGYVIQTGEIILQDDAKVLLTNNQVREAYLA
ncbi:branched-chain amino acid transport system ATP-binding protein [Paenibacillus sp. SORGH_AS306]|uniref:ABC transporter ATP-binding protein n=1 Tax=Paenibacillus kyungheensis TaxID=1452732 RepID=A0AAX3LZD3_9BACL|nr:MULTISPECIES: ABC transporter ATP-binding protein [Paenibacillus]MDQ1235476.1 branched-chain amino acid transport system ATP-binding protein [Paenibacillus sp. SORGH_AS_0306]MDR6112525.1 branched-chain amino acid transport system ATP-binding protein [Paenibacillus sp. SORGH_AS_0338]WCT54997.1 ABC transporter ATP-binding protein [Paenibacillus kyungheensis]